MDVTITVRMTCTAEDTETVRAALTDLADVMLVQAEDGLYSGGHQQAEQAGPLLGQFNDMRVYVDVDL